MSELLKEKARDEFLRLGEKEQGVSVGGLNQKAQSLAATKFYIREIYNPQKVQVEEDDLDEGLIDGANDLGCDFIYRNDGHTLIVQAKYRRTGTPEDAASISHFQSILQRFRNPNLKANKHLGEALAEINWDSDTFELIFFTFGKLEGQARKLTGQQAAYPTDISDLAERCDWRFFDENDLNVELRSARNLQRGASSKAIKLYPVGPKGKRGSSVVEVQAGEYRSFIMALDARQLIKAYEELDKDAIFSLNIRNFIGNTNTNKAIISTAENQPDDFFLYNNGIACLATKATPTDEYLEVSGLQVINGAQTVKALVNLSNLHRRSRTELWTKGAPVVLTRITEVPDGYGAGSRVREKITQYNNTQNTIKISDFRSNDDVQSNLKDQFGELFRKGRKVVYLPKRTDKVPPNSETVRLEEFAKSSYAFLYDPTKFSGSTSFLFSADAEGGYAKIFGDGVKVWQRMPEEDFQLRAGIYWLSQEFASLLKVVRETEEDPDARAALERKWLLIYAASSVAKFHYKKDWQAQIRKLHKGDWTISDDKKGAVVKKMFERAKMGLVLAYRNSKKSNPNFVHRNWMRGKGTPDEITDFLQTVLPTLPDLGNVSG